ncbi:adenylate/guanylate cyclase domain-containing protein [Myxococcaceae bacterium GXIMD 01537]
MNSGQAAEALSAVVGWLTGPARHLGTPGLLLEGLCERLREQGVPLMRASLVLFTLHPLLHGRSYRWGFPYGGSTELHPHGLQHQPGYAQSPFRALREGAPKLRRRLVVAPDPSDFPMLADLRAQGLTDYFALPVCFGDGSRHALSWSTAAPGGFTGVELSVLEGLHPVFQIVVELLSQRDMVSVLLETYLGRDAGQRVLQGQIKRGDGETTSAVICLCDLRGFTALSDRLPREELLELLNAYLATVVGAFHAHGAQVLKFIGDAVLAIFRVEDAEQLEARCSEAVRTLREAVDAAARDNDERRRQGLETYAFSSALHVGDVMYGNIGAPDRLDFTVIGPAVNLASRIAGVSAALDEPMLLSEDFAASYRGLLQDMGTHPLKGVALPARLFAPMREDASGTAVDASTSTFPTQGHALGVSSARRDVSSR